jgi:hypothetical protein
VAVDAGGNVVTATDPPGGASSWTNAHIDSAFNYENHTAVQAALTSISCPLSTLCVAGDNVGNAITSTSPSGGPSGWRSEHIDPRAVGSGYGIASVACTSASLCVAVDGAAGDILTSADPTGGPAGWTVTTTPYALGGVWCPFGGLCVATDEGNSGNVMTMTPTRGVGTWRLAGIDGSNEISGLSCPTRSLCVVSDFRGRVLVGQRLPAAKQIRARLRRMLVCSGSLHAARHRARRDSVRFSAPTAGRLTIAWYVNAVRIATGVARFANGKTSRLGLSLTRVGDRLVESMRRLAVSAKATFTPTGHATIAARVRFLLRRASSQAPRSPC